MTEQLLNTYIEALRQINILSRLDLLLLLPDGNVAANFSHYTQHKMIRTRRANARKKFLDEVLPQFLHEPDYAGSAAPAATDGYFFYALPVMVADIRLLLCLGPFYIDQLVTGMIEADLPHYGINEIPDAASLFSRLSGAGSVCRASDSGDASVFCFPSPDSSSVHAGSAASDSSRAQLSRADEELELAELARQNPVAHIRHNARLEKLIRNAITNGDVEFMEHELKNLYFMEAGHYQANADQLRRMKQIAMLVNTVSCRAAEDGGAPSVWIRSICASISDQIETLNDIARLNDLRKELPLLYCRKVRESKLEGHSPYVRQCIRWIHARLREDITLKAAAAHCGISYEYMSRLINQECGCSFSELLHQIRCQVATDFLKYGASVSETAEKCGYKTSSQFCHAFQKRYGTSPKKWQQEHSS